MHWMVLHRPVEPAALTGKVDTSTKFSDKSSDELPDRGTSCADSREPLRFQE